MPTRPFLPCLKPGCPGLRREGVCSVCGAAKQPRVDRRPSYRQRGYSASWDDLRDWYRARNPLCEVCAALGRTTATEFVHHLDVVADGHPVLCSPARLLAVCRACHAKVEKDQGLGERCKRVTQKG